MRAFRVCSLLTDLMNEWLILSLFNGSTSSVEITYRLVRAGNSVNAVTLIQLIHSRRTHFPKQQEWPTMFCDFYYYYYYYYIYI